MDRHILKGCGTALVTPFKNGQVDYDAYAAMVRRQVDAGIHFLVPLGSTAETPCLTDDEKAELLRVTRANAPGKTLVAGVGTNSLHHTLQNMRLLSQADMYLVVVPYYNKPTQEGMYQYFKAVAAASDKPILLYNVPGRTGINMSAATTLRLSELPNIAGIKEASGSLSQIREILSKCPDDFCVLSGNDDQTLDLMLEGGQGVISVASNIMPEMMVSLTEAAANEDFNSAYRIFRRLIPLFDACFVESNPIPAKGAMHYLGLCTDEMRLPLTPCEPSTARLMARVIDTLRH